MIMYICGQKTLLDNIHRLIDNERFPRFSILYAPTGFGKKLISDYIARELQAHFVPCSNKAEDVKQTVDNAYTISQKTLYMFYDCDDMSVNAKNALLKVTEEPPNSAYFIITVTDLSRVLDTLISRGTVFYFQPYSVQDLKEYIEHKKYELNKEMQNIAYSICTCPAEINMVMEINLKEVYDLADTFIQYIGGANIANELKMGLSLSSKKEDGKIDPVIFMRCVLLCCNQYILNNCSLEDLAIFHSIIKETTAALQDLMRKSCNRQMCIDNWIIKTHFAISG